MSRLRFAKYKHEQSMRAGSFLHRHIQANNALLLILYKKKSNETLRKYQLNLRVYKITQNIFKKSHSKCLSQNVSLKMSQ